MKFLTILLSTIIIYSQQDTEVYLFDYSNSKPLPILTNPKNISNNLGYDNQPSFSKNGNCSWVEVECLGACVSAPMIQINDDYYEDLDEKSTIEILDSLIKDKPLKPGSYRGRKNTAPERKKIKNGESYA